MILSGDYLYFGEAKFAQTDSHKLFIYKRSSAKIVKTILLNHSVQYLAKTSNDGVVLTGKTSNPWLSYITQVTPQGSDFQVSTELVRGQQLVEHIANDTQGTLYFSDPGSRTVFNGARSGLSTFMNGIPSPCFHTNHVCSSTRPTLLLLFQNQDLVLVSSTKTSLPQQSWD